MFCIQESEPRVDPFSKEKDPLSNTPSDSSDDEPTPKRLKTYESTISPSLNLKVYQIPTYNTPKSLQIYPTTASSALPQFVNNPLNLANPLALMTAAKTLNENNIVKNLQSRFSLPARLSITPVSVNKIEVSETGEIIRYKKNGEIAKKRGPPKGYKRKPKADLSQSFNEATKLSISQPQHTELTNLLSTSKIEITPVEEYEPIVESVPIHVPEGTELVQLSLEPADWFPEEPYKMSFSRKKNPKWKNFPFQCEHCFKGYRVVSTLISHAEDRHGGVPRCLAIPCPCCPHVSTRRKQHKKHLETHEGKRHRIFCVYCVPPYDATEPYVKEAIKYPFDKYPQYWFASEESLRLHKKRKHPYAAMYNYNWYGTWGDNQPNS